MHSGQSPKEIRRRNRSLVLREVMRHGVKSRTDLAEITGLTNTAITRITRELIELGLLCEAEKQDREGQPGRKRIVLNVNPEGAYVIGIGIHASDHSVTLANLKGDLVRREIIPQSILHDPEATLSLAGDLALEFLTDARRSDRTVLGVGVAVAGVVDSEAGVVLEIPQFNWRDVSVVTYLEGRLNLPVVIDNVNNVLCLAEWQFGKARDAKDILLVRSATFIGGSIVSDGRLTRGSSSRAAQMGHMPIGGGTGGQCICGRRGCLNTVASGLSILARAKGMPFEMFRIEDIDTIHAELSDLIEVARQGDVSAQKVFEEAGRELGRAVSVMTSIVDPETILLGGQMGRCEFYQQGMEAGLAENPSIRLPEAARVQVINMTIPQATVFTALEQLAFSPRLDVSALRQPANDIALRA